MYNNKMNTAGYERYREQHVLQASPQELVIMIYDCCIKNLKLAKLSIEDKEFDKSNKELQKAQDCVSELIMSLDFNYEVSKPLMSLYDYLITEIIKINMDKSMEMIEPLLGILVELRDAWSEASKLIKRTAFSGGEM